MEKTTQAISLSTRAPVIAVLGHIDHGKSTLLDYLRKTNVVEKEAGGITQHLSAYEVTHKGEKGALRTITFLDTPGHEAFVKMRSRGADAADIAILVVSAEDGVKPQTLEALKSIRDAKRPFVVAITKIDKPNANVERVKANLIENEIYLEGMGGDVPYVPISSKSGEGIPQLLDILLLVADLAELRADPRAPASGVVIEAHRDPKRGIAATLIVKDGTLASGSFVIAGAAYSPVRIMENFLGKPAKKIVAGTPARIIGWSELPEVGSPFTAVEKKKEAEEITKTERLAMKKKTPVSASEGEKLRLPIVIKADTAGSLEAIEHELAKFSHERITMKIVERGVGPVSEADVKALGTEKGIIVGFNSPVESAAKILAERDGVEVATFDIIYKLSEWLAEKLTTAAPKVDVEESSARLKVLRKFNTTKDKHVIGARMEEGAIALGDQVKIIRQKLEVGKGKITNLQQQKVDVKKVTDGEFGAEVQSKIEIMPGDELQSFVVVKR